MSIIDRSNATTQQFYKGGETCFRCGQAVWERRAIFWTALRDKHDEPVDAVFHPGCAIEFVLALARDVNQLIRDESLLIYLKGPRKSRSEVR